MPRHPATGRSWRTSRTAHREHRETRACRIERRPGVQFRTARPRRKALGNAAFALQLSPQGTSCASSVGSSHITITMAPRRVKPKLVRESEAQGRVREIYDDIKRLFGVPHIKVIFQAYAASPKFLEILWSTLSPAVQTAEFFSCADRLRAEAITIMHNYYSVPDLCARIRDLQFSEGAQHELTDVTELFCYNDALMLLFVATACRAMDAPVGTGQEGSSVSSRAPIQERPVMLDDAQ